MLHQKHNKVARELYIKKTLVTHKVFKGFEFDKVVSYRMNSMHKLQLSQSKKEKTLVISTILFQMSRTWETKYQCNHYTSTSTSLFSQCDFAKFHIVAKHS